MQQQADDETLDSVFGGEIKLWQHRSGYRFSLDSVLLAYFVSIRTDDSVMDLGTGNGVIPMMLAYLYPSISIDALEVQPSMARRAQRNAGFNRFDDRITITCLDLKNVSLGF